MGGCESAAIAQIMYYHGLCPRGSISYEAPGFTETGMNFSAAEIDGLCDWNRFVSSPPNSTTDPSTKIVARYLYAASLVVEKKWGTGSYMLSHAASARAVEEHYRVIIEIVSANTVVTLRDLEQAIVVDITVGRPLKLHIASIQRGAGPEHSHHVVIDGYRSANSKFWVHLNVGHSGFDDGWYDFEQPICLLHYQNGTLPASGDCAFNYDDTQYKEIW